MRDDHSAAILHARELADKIIHKIRHEAKFVDHLPRVPMSLNLLDECATALQTLAGIVEGYDKREGGGG